MDKLAEEILMKIIYPESTKNWITNTPDMGIPVHMVIKAMQAYHEAKLKEELQSFAEYWNKKEEGFIVYTDITKYLKQRTNGTI